jgi:succinyl-CoA:acetate CoA-transferase
MTTGPDRVAGDLPVRDATTVAAGVAADATLAVSGFGSVGDPKATPAALAASDRDLALTVVSGGSTGEAVDGALVEADAVTRRFPFVATDEARAAVDDGRIAFADRHVAGLADEVAFGRLGDPDVAVVEAVAVGEGWLAPSTSLGQTPAYVAAADEVVVEVNRAQPRGLARLHDVYRPAAPPDREPIPLTDPAGRIGAPRVVFDPAKLRAVVETDRPDDPYEFREPTAADEAVAANLVRFLATERGRDPVLRETLTLQFGVGSLGNALMGALAGSSLADGRLRYFGEVVQDGLLDLLDTGALDGASATALALSEAGQERLFADLDRYADEVVLRPTDVSNAPALVDRFGVVAVNSALSVDIYGHANVTHVDGTRIVSGVGGGGDFARAAHLSVVALPSTAKGGGVSRVVPFVRHVDHTEHDVDVVVTDHGVADLRGLDPRERADRLVELADPAHRPALRSYRERASGGHVPHDLETAFDWQ